MNVQEAWDDFENKLIKIVDSLVPMSEFTNNSISNSPNEIIIRKKT